MCTPKKFTIDSVTDSVLHFSHQSAMLRCSLQRDDISLLFYINTSQGDNFGDRELFKQTAHWKKICHFS